jgi:hypothetical protein
MLPDNVLKLLPKAQNSITLNSYEVEEGNTFEQV